MPQEQLKQKAQIFEESAGRFENQRQVLSDFIAVDRRRLLSELDVEIESFWKKAQSEIRSFINAFVAQRMGEKEARDRLGAVLTQRFEGAFPEAVDLFKAKLADRLAVHRERADALLRLVRQAAADLMEIPVTLPSSEEAFVLKRTPYWVGAEASNVSIIGLSTSALASLLPKSLRERRALPQSKIGCGKGSLAQYRKPSMGGAAEYRRCFPAIRRSLVGADSECAADDAGRPAIGASAPCRPIGRNEQLREASLAFGCIAARDRS